VSRAASKNRISCRDPEWLPVALRSLQADGYMIVEDVLPDSFLRETREKMYRVQDRILSELGADVLRAAGERGVLRLMMRFDDFFVRYLELAPLLAVIDATVSKTAILHLQNGFVLPSVASPSPDVFQYQFHRDFPRWLNGYLASINLLFAIDGFTSTNGATVIVPGSHRSPELPSVAEMKEKAIPVECEAGSMVLFDSTLGHAAGTNTSGHDRLAINHQFTRSFFKQQFDYVRALGEEVVTSQTPRTRQLLGYSTRLPSSLQVPGLTFRGEGRRETGRPFKRAHG
jgi:ectoine hydroxylase-related dioxygenase (phytanoyl-CoA dioxygenase family)